MPGTNRSSSSSGNPDVTLHAPLPEWGERSPLHQRGQAAAYWQLHGHDYDSCDVQLTDP
jgi:hypothetical protein